MEPSNAIEHGLLVVGAPAPGAPPAHAVARTPLPSMSHCTEARRYAAGGEAGTSRTFRTWDRPRRSVGTVT